jgi:hypothetical protein
MGKRLFNLHPSLKLNQHNAFTTMRLINLESGCMSKHILIFNHSNQPNDNIWGFIEDWLSK